MLEFLGLVFGSLGLLGCWDRIRQINWHTTRPLVVGFYLAGALWSLGVLYDSFASGIEWYQLLGMTLVLVALFGSRHRWRNGPPPGVTKPAPLGDPEVSGWS